MQGSHVETRTRSTAVQRDEENTVNRWLPGPFLRFRPVLVVPDHPSTPTREQDVTSQGPKEGPERGEERLIIERNETKPAIDRGQQR